MLSIQIIIFKVSFVMTRAGEIWGWIRPFEISLFQKIPSLGGDNRVFCAVWAWRIHIFSKNNFIISVTLSSELLK